MLSVANKPIILSVMLSVVAPKCLQNPDLFYSRMQFMAQAQGQGTEL